MTVFSSNLGIYDGHSEFKASPTSFLGGIVNSLLIIRRPHKSTINYGYPNEACTPNDLRKYLNTVVLVEDVIHGISEPSSQIPKKNHAPIKKALQGRALGKKFENIRNVGHDG